MAAFLSSKCSGVGRKLYGGISKNLSGLLNTSSEMLGSDIWSQKRCRQHFDEEEKELLPLIEATDEMSENKQKAILEQCFDSMKATHSSLFDFFLEGLLPLQAMQYLDIFMNCDDKEQTTNKLYSSNDSLAIAAKFRHL